MPLRFRILMGLGPAIVLLAAAWSPEGAGTRWLLAGLFVFVSLVLLLLVLRAARDR